MLEGYSWPKEDVILFSNEGNYYETAHYGWNSSEGAFYGYIMGYKKSADVLVDLLNVKKDISYSDTIIYPVCFLYRQFIELSLKKIYLSFSKDSHDEKIAMIISVSHNLKKIWDEVKKIISESANVKEKKTIEDVEKYILQYHEFDQNSFTYRYPITKKIEETTNVETRVNLNNLKKRMNELEHFFGGVEGQMYSIRDCESGM